METKTDMAFTYFKSGYNCAQSVLGAFCLEAGLDINTAFKLANGFGGGVRCGELCGAVSGALMALGLQYGFYIENDIKQKNICNERAYAFIEKFKEENGSVLCRDLLGCDIRRPADHTTPEAREAHSIKCPALVTSAVRLLECMMSEEAKRLTDS